MANKHTKSGNPKKYPMQCVMCGALMHNVHQTHNALPVKAGRCCDTCNMQVILARISMVYIPTSK